MMIVSIYTHQHLNFLMMFLYFCNTQASVPPVFGTTPCIKQIFYACPTICPRLTTDGKILERNETL